MWVMAGYLQLGEVSTWYGEYGSGEPLVLLHPGGADSRAWGANLDALSAEYQVFTPDRRGHGRTADVAGPISYQQMADDTVLFLDEMTDGPVRLVGCSDGATVGLLTALTRPDLVQRLVIAAGVFHHDGWIPGAIDLDDETFRFLADWHAEVSPDGPGHFAVVAGKMEPMHAGEPTLTAADLSKLEMPVLIMIGDRDEVRMEHAVEMYRAIPGAELAIVPGASHGLLVEKPELCNKIMMDFLR
jgi:pimeloyl-ACP methyl ester carboxylesterase